MYMNANRSAAGIIQAEWRSAPITEKMKLAQKAQRLGVTYAAAYKSLEELTDMLAAFNDRELKISFLAGFEAGLASTPAVVEDIKNFIHYEKLRNKRTA